jgi:hypothetical protein
MRIAYIISFMLIAATLWLPMKTLADGNCLPLYNGGTTTKQYCQSPTPTPANSVVQQTGGQPVYPSPKTKTTPDTGPASWSLIGLFFIAGIGFLLRDKAKT